MVSAEAKMFAFRMPVDLKAAAVALTKTSISNWNEDGSQARGVISPTSINDALISLMRAGLGRLLSSVERDLPSSEESVKYWKGLAKHLLNNADSHHLTAEDFPEGSELRIGIETDDENNKHTGAPLGWSRQQIFDELANAQRRLTCQLEARDALLIAAKG